MVMGGIFLLLAFLVSAAVFVHGQPGFISIDCGIAEGLNYTDNQTQIEYTSDNGFIDTGINQEISSVYTLKSTQRLYQNLRSFPEGIRNCYTLKPVVKGNKYLIRASFMYGNYDGTNKLPVFDVYLGANLWQIMKFPHAHKRIRIEIMVVAYMDIFSVCLINRGWGAPFISVLELRPLNNSLYTTVNESQSLLLYNRFNPGAPNDRDVRYPDDPYDRIWKQWVGPWTPFSTPSIIEIENDFGFEPPTMVMSTAVSPLSANDNLNFSFPMNDTDSGLQFYVYMHFAELQLLDSNQLREFTLSLNGAFLDGPFSPMYQVARTLSSPSPLTGKDNYTIALYKTTNSTLPPILNAFEIHSVKQHLESATNRQDFDSIMNIKATYRVKRNWMGDPCLPKAYSWDGLNCSYDSSYPPTITSLNLSSSGLSGEIAPSLGNLTSIVSLDLSRNNLTGAVPDFLANLSSLTFLNLRSNQFTGSIPSVLLERSHNGLLTLSFGENLELCSSDSCKKKHRHFNIPVIIGVSVVAVLVSFTMMIVCHKFRGRRQGEPAFNASEEDSLFFSRNRRFTYTEIMHMTNNFQRVIGRGGFGTVYHGHMEDGTQVAIKLFSQIHHGTNVFQTEAQLLMRFHHKNLVHFLGYCAEGNNKALILEYIVGGNLANLLSAKGDDTIVLNWDQRLRIAMDVAQGLEYLHTGCKPPIIHRDVKAANILINERLEAKIADFGLSKAFLDEELTHISTDVKGTQGYLDPEYFISNNLNEKSDVYSFGVVLLELITGKTAITRLTNSERITIVKWVTDMIGRGDIRNIVDPRLGGHCDVNSVWKAIEIAIACTPPIAIQRPSMSDVVMELKECLQVDIAPEENRMSMKIEEPEILSSDSMSYPSAR
ncbi:putative LRR receptor-like serine/threonine-protein kinase At1g05700 isoform X1 [Tasmannia lanceolata]|uniref:putative LRR receptor-like serine/threonine-protein kinase At1g05700 isoform X1 n=1 Tax=Tasmannia lanceolata TaxID=3420 RepID=UPI004062A743